MKLLRLELQNFLPYEKKFEIDFRTSESAPIILFLGKNNHGKSSIFHAIRWCLYGQTEKKKQKIGEATLFNRTAAVKALDDPSIRMRVALEWETQGKTYSLTREAWFKPGGMMSTEASLRIDGNNPVAENMIQTLVRKFLPKEISHLFLYDGESQREFDDMNTDGRGREFIQAEIENTLSIPYLRAALSFIKDKREVEFASIQAGEKLSEQVKRWQLEKEQKNKEKNQHLATSDQAKRKRSEAQSRIDEISDLLGDVDRFQELKRNHELAVQNLTSCEENLTQTQARLRSYFQTSPWLPLFEKLKAESEQVWSAKAENQKVADEISLSKAKIGIFESQRSASKCVTCGTLIEPDEVELDNKITELRARIEVLESQDDSGLAYKAELLDKIKFNETVPTLCSKDAAELDRVRGKLAASKMRVIETQNALGGFQTNDINHTDLLSEYQTCQKTVLSMKNIIADTEKKLSEVEADIQRLNDKMGKSVAISPKKQGVLDYWDDVRLLLEAGLSEYITATKKSVEQLASETFVKIVNDPKWVGLELNEAYGAQPLLATESRDDLTNTGSDKAISVALVDGLLRTALDEGFVLMDSPLVSWDKELRANFASWAINSRMKIALFLHSGEYDDQVERDLFEGKIGAIYKISKVTDDESVITKVA